jgi:hypothetical protein
VQATGSFTTPLLIGAAISLVGAAIYWLVPRGPITADELAEAPAGVVPVS